MLNFAYVVHKCAMHMATKMGIPGGVKRYMDAITAALLCQNPEEVTAATAFVHELNKPTAHPPPLCLNTEPQGNQEFLEVTVLVAVSGNWIALSLNNKVMVDALYLLPPTNRGCLPRYLVLLMLTALVVTGEWRKGYLPEECGLLAVMNSS